MKITKRQLKRIIREEYSRLKQRGLIREWNDGSDVSAKLLKLASRAEGISMDEINDLFGDDGFEAVDEMAADQIVWLDDQEGVVYSAGSQPSQGLGGAIERYTGAGNSQQDLGRFAGAEAQQSKSPQARDWDAYNESMLDSYSSGRDSRYSGD